MPYSYVETPALGDTNIFPVPFLFLKRPDIHAFVDEVEVKPLVWPAANMVRLPIAAADLAGKVVRIQRITPSQTAAVTFKPGGLDHGDLNVSILQLLYVSQEAADRLAALPNPLPGNRYDFRGRRATNVGDPQAGQDAATASWVNSRVAVLLGEAGLDELFHTDSARFRALFSGFLNSLPTEEPLTATTPWMNGGLLSFTGGEGQVPSDEQAAFNASFAPLFVAYLQQRPTEEPTSGNAVWLNGGLVALATG